MTRARALTYRRHGNDAPPTRVHYTFKFGVLLLVLNVEHDRPEDEHPHQPNNEQHR